MLHRSLIITILIIIAVAVFQAAVGPSKKIFTNKDRSMDVEKKAGAARKTAILPEVPGIQGTFFVIVLDDLGYSRKNLEKLVDLGINITAAVLPDAPYSREICSFLESNGIETILHLPMEPEENTRFLEADTLNGTMSEDEVRAILNAAFSSVFTARGVSNHMGSKGTKDKRLVNIIFDEIKKREMYFLDSFTSPDSVCEKVSCDKNIPFIKRDIFIDNTGEEQYIEDQILAAEQIARDKGFVVAIGHDRMVTVDVLRKMVPQLKKRGVKFLTVSELLEKKEEKKKTGLEHASAGYKL